MTLDRVDNDPIVVADPSRERRLFLEHAFDAVGCRALCTASGAEALQLVRDAAPPVLVAHVAIRVDSLPITRAIEEECSALGNTRTLWFCEGSSPRTKPTHSRRSTFVQCGENPALIVRAVQRLLNHSRCVRRVPSDFLLTLMLLEAELSELTDSCIG